MKARIEKSSAKSGQKETSKAPPPVSREAASSADLPNGAYLVDVLEEDIHLDESHPIYVRHGIVRKEDKITPRFHPYLEFGIRFKGTGTFFVEGEVALRRPYDVYLGAINQPHAAGVVSRQPIEYVTVHFLPSILSECGSDTDGISILDRFIADQPLEKRLVRPPPELRKKLVRGFRQILTEFQGKEFGRMIKIEALVLGLLVELIRWEQQTGSFPVSAQTTSGDWKHVVKAMRYIRQNYAEHIYGPEIAAACGLNKTSLQAAFRNTLKIPWVRYLQLFRIHRAALLLKAGKHNVTEASLACGFESLGHFIRTFRSLKGVTPRSYLAKASAQISNGSH